MGVGGNILAEHVTLYVVNVIIGHLAQSDEIVSPQTTSLRLHVHGSVATWRLIAATPSTKYEDWNSRRVTNMFVDVVDPTYTIPRE